MIIRVYTCNSGKRLFDYGHLFMGWGKDSAVPGEHVVAVNKKDVKEIVGPEGTAYEILRLDSVRYVGRFE